MREYNHALIFAKKMLRLSWIINNPEYELLSYDKIGLICYYKGNLEQADFFHEKSYSNSQELKTSNIR